MSKKRLMPNPLRTLSGLYRRRNSFLPSVESLEDRTVPSTYVVNTPLDVVNGADTLLSLREAIEEANANPGADTIKFAPSALGTINLNAGFGQLMITDDLTIKGPGADKLTVSGQGAIRVFAVLPEALAANPFVTPSLAQIATSPEVTIERLTVSLGVARDALGFDPADPTNPGFAFGGGLFNLGGTVHLDRVDMTANQAAFSPITGQGVVTAGGAVANEFGGTLTVSRSSFEGNTSQGALIGVGGAITSDLGPTTDGVTTGQPDVKISQSTFIGNTARSFAGYIDGVAFSGLAGGGAVLNVTGLMDIQRSKFINNTAEGGTGNGGSTAGGPAFGGAVFSGDASPFGVADSVTDISNSNFEGNSATGGNGGANDVPGGEAAGGAVAIANAGDSELRFNTFRNNEATGGDGGNNANGGVATGGAVAGFAGADLSLERNNFFGNQAVGGAGAGTGTGGHGQGGALGLGTVELAGFLPIAPTAEVSRDVFIGNQATGGLGGGIFNEGDLTVRNAYLGSNQATGRSDVLIDSVPGYVFTGVALGGGISNIGTVNVSGTTFYDNQATGADGAVGPNFLSTGEVTYPGIGVGGGLHNINDATVTSSRFVRNVARGGDGNSGTFSGIGIGGGVYNDGSISITRSSFDTNRALGGNDNAGDLGSGSGAGGGLASGSVTVLLGARSASLVIDNSTFHRNDSAGGEDNSVLTAVPRAHAPGNALGGGIYVYQGAAAVTNTYLNRNQAVGGDGGTFADTGDSAGGIGIGGGIFFESFVLSTNSELSRSTVIGNSATGNNGENGLGGGVAVATLGSLFANPVAPGVSNISDTRIISNVAEGLGGGIYNEVELTVERSQILANSAIGSADQIVSYHAAANAPGSAGGGGISNFGTLAVRDSTLSANRAVGADGSTSPHGGFPFEALPGIALGGGLSNNGTATVEGSRITGNIAKAGDNTVGDFAGLASGGGIYNDANLFVTGSLISSNKAIAGDGGFSAFHNGHALGGGIGSGSLLPAVDMTSTGASLVVEQSQIVNNRAIGGNQNQVFLPPTDIPPADGPNNAYGGGILVYQGTANLDRVRIVSNRAVAGNGGAGENGSIAAGGGVFFFSFLGGVQATLTNSFVGFNAAVGGNGLAGGEGGDGLGGGIAAGSLDAPFGGPGTLTVQDTTVRGNLARGGAIGGDGLGGGIYNASGSTLDLLSSFVFRNLALGGPGGDGIGGGVYNDGMAAVLTSMIFANFASTSDDDCFGC